MADIKMWTSKLGNRYPMASIQDQDRETQKELKRLRGLKHCGNDSCADCGSPDNSWASVTHGVFVCIICADVHRSVGTHVTKMKGCTGTYLWGPDEIEKMQATGNRKADATYGAKKIAPDASKQQKQDFVIDKYVKLAFVGVSSALPPPECGTSGLRSADRKQVVDLVAIAPERLKQVAPASAAKHVPAAAASHKALKADIPDSFFDDLFGTSDPVCCAAEIALPDRSTTSADDDAVRRTGELNELDDFFKSFDLPAAPRPTPISKKTDLDLFFEDFF